MEETLQAWMTESEKVFQRCNLSSSGLSVTSGINLWQVDPYTEGMDDPGSNFFRKPALILQRQFLYPKGQRPSEENPISGMFTFDETKIQQDFPKDLETIIKHAPPLNSIFADKDVEPIQDKRMVVGMIKPGDLSYVTAEFKTITAQAKIIEPIIINAFLWDPERKRRISENWRFMPDSEEELQADKHTFALINPMWIKGPKKISFPMAQIHSNAELVLFLDRLVFNGGGEKMMKYYEKCSESARQAALADLKECNQPDASQTFAWTHVPLRTLVPTGDPKVHKFDKFVAGQSVSDEYLASAISKQYEKVIPLAVSLTFSTEQIGTPRLRNYFDFPKCPNMEFTHEMIVQISDTKFRFPRGMRGRNIYAQVQLIMNNHPLPVFNGQVVHTTRCQYHVEDPTFHEDIVIQLPKVLDRSAYLRVQFMHASVKEKAKNSRELCGATILPLFEHGYIIADGVHKTGIGYTAAEEGAPATESNFVTFHTSVRSSLFASDPNVQEVFNRRLKNISKPENNVLVPHMFGVLDVLIEEICKGTEEAFDALMVVMSAFTRDKNTDEKYLTFYVKFCAFRSGRENSFHKNFVKLWKKHMEEKELDAKKAVLVHSWFLFELLIKSLVLDPESVDYDMIIQLLKLYSDVMPNFRESGQKIGGDVNEAIAFFCKDLFEFVDRSHVVAIVRQHLGKLDVGNHKNWFDRLCFKEFIQEFLTPKVFVYFIGPRSGSLSLFDEIILPHIEAGFTVYEHTNSLFQYFYNLLSQFEAHEHKVIGPRLMNLCSKIGAAGDIIKMYENRSFSVYLLVVAHYILYYGNIGEISHEFAKACGSIISLVRRLSRSDAEKIKAGAKSTTEDLTKICNMRTSEYIGTQSTNKRSFNSLKMSREKMLKGNDDGKDMGPVFDALSFCIQSLMLKFLVTNQNIHTLNSILSQLGNLDIPPLLEPEYRRVILDFSRNRKDVWFSDPSSNLKHVIRKLLEKVSAENVQVIQELIKLESQQCTTSNRCIALTVRALSKIVITQKTVQLMQNTMFGNTIASLYEIQKNLDSEELKTTNPDVYSEMLFKKAELLSKSPDARVAVLLELTSYHESMKYMSEAVISQLTAAALVAEYMYRLGRIPNFYEPDEPIKRFAVACPSAVSEECPAEVLADIPKIRGYCTSKYFSEYGLIFMIMTANEACKRGSLFELSTKIHNVLSPIAEYRRLWDVMAKHFRTGQHAWNVISKMSSTSDRALGMYYVVQYQNGGTFIYRETALATLWDVNAKLKKSALFYSNGLPVEVVNEGEKLDPEKMDPSKYYVHVKAVSQYFSREDRKNRVTVFEQHHNVSQFYFDIPLKGAQDGIEHCSLKRTIFTLPHPMPYIVKHVEIPLENIKTTIFSPIEYSCQNLQTQIARIEEEIARRNYTGLQMLIQGSLLVQVNEGPKTMAEVFLGKSRDIGNSDHLIELRATFRKFLEAQSKAVKLHAEFAREMPVYAVLQEQLEAGLNRLTSALQPYLS